MNILAAQRHRTSRIASLVSPESWWPSLSRDLCILYGFCTVVKWGGRSTKFCPEVNKGNANTTSGQQNLLLLSIVEDHVQSCVRCYLVKCLYLRMEVFIKATGVSVANLVEISVLLYHFIGAVNSAKSPRNGWNSKRSKVQCANFWNLKTELVGNFYIFYVFYMLQNSVESVAKTPQIALQGF